jgi:hypothetical protein
MGKQPNLVIKIATVLSSLLLVGGCVSYRAGVFDNPLENKSNPSAEQESPTRPPLDSAKIVAEPAPSDTAGTAAKKSDFVLSPGTKAPLRGSIITPSNPWGP